MPKLEIPKFDPNAPLHNFEPDYELLNSIQEDIAEEKRKQERKTTIFAGLSILIGVIGLFLAYFTLDATLKANAANQAATDATNKLLQLQEIVRQQQAQFLSYQTKNDSMNTIVSKMNETLKKHGLAD